MPTTTMRSSTALIRAVTFVIAVAAAAPTAFLAAEQSFPDGVRVTVSHVPEECERKTAAGDRLKMHYTGTIDSTSKTGTPEKKFDSSLDRGDPFEFEIGAGQVIKGWDAGLLGMCVGEKRTLVLDPEYGYGENGAGADIPGGATLNFETELLEIIGAAGGDSSVIVGTDASLQGIVDDNDNVLVEFYAPWCGHCKSLAPEYEKAASALEKKAEDGGHKVVLVKVDATVETASAEKYSVSGYPTLVFFKNGAQVEFEGGRSADGIVEWLEKRSGPEWKPPPSRVLTLTEANFRATVDDAELIIVEFYAPWCGHCKKLAPEYEKAAKQLYEEDKDIKLAKIDATSETAIAEVYSVTGYPTLKIFRKGKVYDYSDDGREASSIVSYAKSQSGPGAKETNSKNFSQTLESASSVVFLATFDDVESMQYTNLLAVGNKLRDTFPGAIFWSTDPALTGRYSPGIIHAIQPPRFATTKLEGRVKGSTGNLAGEDVAKAFMLQNALPLIGQIDRTSNSDLYSKIVKDNPLAVIYYTVDFDGFEERKMTNFWKEKFVPLASSLKGAGVFFAVADDETHSNELKQFGLGESADDVLCVVFVGKKAFPYTEEECTPDSLEGHIQAVLDRKSSGMKPYIKSAKAPRKNKGAVTIVVGSTFEKIVQDPKNDVLIEFYAPWCGHCKSLAPIYKSLGKRFKKTKNVVIAKMDATANDIPWDGMEANGYPTIYFSPAAAGGGEKTFEKYEGGRSLEDFTDFIIDKATAPLSDKLRSLRSPKKEKGDGGEAKEEL